MPFYVLGTLWFMNLSSPAAVSALLRKYGLHPRKRFGQNFLVDAGTLGKIVSAGGVNAGDLVLEIGGGLGVLTRALAGSVGESGRVVAVEIDRDLQTVLAETTGDLPQITISPGDALALDLPALLSHHGHSADRPARAVANIPYNITSPLLATLLAVRPPLSVIVLLVQKEVAERLTAGAGTDAYGALSVFAQFHTNVETVGTVSRRVFLPAPDVDSAIVRLTPHSLLPVAVASEEQFFRVVRAAFGQRRKSLLNALSGDPQLQWTREEAQRHLDSAGIDGGRRGETLTLTEFAALSG